MEQRMMKKMRKKHKAPVLYMKYLQEQKEKDEIERISEELGADEEKIVVTKIPAGARFLELFGAALRIGVKVLFIAIVFGLASIGLTVLCNSYLRDTFFRALTAAF